jgi:hypothetical protein
MTGKSFERIYRDDFLSNSHFKNMLRVIESV